MHEVIEIYLFADLEEKTSFPIENKLRWRRLHVVGLRLLRIAALCLGCLLMWGNCCVSADGIAGISLPAISAKRSSRKQVYLAVLIETFV